MGEHLIRWFRFFNPWLKLFEHKAVGEPIICYCEHQHGRDSDFLWSSHGHPLSHHRPVPSLDMEFYRMPTPQEYKDYEDECERRLYDR
jgi:hypothetical protein